MPAKIEGSEVAFPFGENIKIDPRGITCTVVPEMKDRKPTEKGVITITLPYEDATCASSSEKLRPRGRLFSVCNQDGKNTVFTRFISCVARFNTNPLKKTTVEGVGPKEFSILIEGEGTKKNSSPS